MSHGCVNPIGIAPDLSFLLYKNKSSFAMLFALGCYSYIVPNRNCGVPPLLIRLKAPSLRVFSHEGEALDQYDERVKYYDI